MSNSISQNGWTEVAVLKLQCEETDWQWVVQRKMGSVLPTTLQSRPITTTLSDVTQPPCMLHLHTKKKPHPHIFWVILTPHCCSSMFSATCSSLNWLSGTCILESRWLSLTPHIITGSHSWLISSHKMILCCLSRKKCRLGEINKWWSNSKQSYPHPLVSFWD